MHIYFSDIFFLLKFKISVILFKFSHLSSLSPHAGPAYTFPPLPISGPFFPDVPVFHVPSDTVFPSQPRASISSIFISATAPMFSVSSLLFKGVDPDAKVGGTDCCVKPTFSSWASVGRCNKNPGYAVGSRPDAIYTSLCRLRRLTNECRLEGDKTHEIFHFLSKKVGGTFPMWSPPS